MDTWRWILAGIEAALLLVLVLLWADNVRERRDFQPRDVLRPYLAGVLIVPAGFILVLLMPLPLSIALVAIPAVVVVTMALAS